MNEKYLSPHVQLMLDNRGPDAQNSMFLSLHQYKVHIYSTILHLRGPSTVTQPVQSERFIFLYNGEIYGNEVGGDCDTLYLLRSLENRGDDFLKVFGQVCGEFAFVLVDLEHSIIYYGRDQYGRRSLLVRKDGVDSLCISSAGIDGQEVSSIGIHQFNVISQAESIIPWSRLGKHVPKISSELSNPIQSLDISCFKGKLMESVERRLVGIHDSIDILFSGGVDSLAMAAIAHLVAPPNVSIICINVAFSIDGKDYDLAPDRKTGQLAFKELEGLFPDRSFKFTAVNIHSNQVQEKREHICKLMFPNASVMDESISIGLWFAALNSQASRVILVGMGADEQLGGYSRHAFQVKLNGVEGLVSELQMDLDRISSRNLGRDDRIIADHGKEARFPFLDDHFVDYLSNVPINFKYLPELGRGCGDKYILREMLRSIGFSACVCNAVKRAIQFGARVAHLQKQGL